jgi:hypothetical protein
VKFILFTWVSPEGETRWNAMSREARAANVERHREWFARHGASISAGEELGDRRRFRVVRRSRDGRPMVTDGPFAETKEWVGGFIVVDVPDRGGRGDGRRVAGPRLPRPRRRGRADRRDGPLSEPARAGTPGLVPCPDCRALVAAVDGPTHAYIGGNAGCWEAWGELQARACADPTLAAVMPLAVSGGSHPAARLSRPYEATTVRFTDQALAMPPTQGWL